MALVEEILPRSPFFLHQICTKNENSDGVPILVCTAGLLQHAMRSEVREWLI